MLSQLSLKLKIMVLSGLVISSLIWLTTSAMHELSDYEKYVADRITTVENQVANLSDISNAHVEFKIQVQEWKNILIRGNDVAQYDKYLKQFNQQSDKVQQLLSSARE